MTEIFTNDVNRVDNTMLTENNDVPDDLDASEQRFYKAISNHLSLIQIHPKQETVFKIITYSRTKK